jgi:hypothetical protein
VAGEIIVLDSGGYGPVTLVQSITISAPAGIYAGISVFTGDGVTINGSNIVVALRGLTINGQGGNNGVNVVNAAMVHVESCVIANMGNAGLRQVAGALEAKDTIVRNGAYGLYVQGPATATLDRVRVEGNATGVAAEYGAAIALQDSVVTRSSNIGVVAINGTFPSNAAVTINRSLIAFNLDGIYLDPGDGNAEPNVNVFDSTISDNASYGAYSHGPSRFNAARTSFVRNAGGLRLAAGASAYLDSDYLEWNGVDIDAEGGSVVHTRGNNNWTDFATAGTIITEPGR